MPFHCGIIVVIPRYSIIDRIASRVCSCWNCAVILIYTFTRQPILELAPRSTPGGNQCQRFPGIGRIQRLRFRRDLGIRFLNHYVQRPLRKIIIISAPNYLVEYRIGIRVGCAGKCCAVLPVSHLILQFSPRSVPGTDQCLCPSIVDQRQRFRFSVKTGICLIDRKFFYILSILI